MAEGKHEKFWQEEWDASLKRTIKRMGKKQAEAGGMYGSFEKWEMMVIKPLLASPDLKCTQEYPGIFMFTLGNVGVGFTDHLETAELVYSQHTSSFRCAMVDGKPVPGVQMKFCVDRQGVLWRYASLALSTYYNLYKDGKMVSEYRDKKEYERIGRLLLDQIGPAYEIVGNVGQQVAPYLTDAEIRKINRITVKGGESGEIYTVKVGRITTVNIFRKRLGLSEYPVG